MSDRLIKILIDSFPKILIPGLRMTIPLTLASFAVGFVIALALALIQVAKVPVLNQIAKIYIWIFRGTPLLVQLFIIFFGLPGLGRNDVPPDYDPCGTAAGVPHCFSTIVQFSDWTCKGYVARFEHYGHRTLYSGTADCGTDV